MSQLSSFNLRNSVVKSSLMLILALMLGLLLVACGENSTTTIVPNPTTALITTASSTTQPDTPPAATTSTTSTTATIAALATVTPAPTIQNTTVTTAAAITSQTIATPIANPTTTVALTTAQSTVAPTTTVVQSNTTSIATTAQTTTVPVATTAPATTTVTLTTPGPTPGGMGKLAYIESGNLYIYDFSNQSKKMLYQATGTSGIVGTPVWSPDNSSLLLTLRDNLKNANSRTNLYLLKLNGSEPQKIMVSGLVATCEESPVWSGDGRYIAFTEVLDPTRTGVFNLTNQREIWLVDANGQNPRKIADGLEPAWSADSSSLAYVSNGSLKVGDSFRQTNAIHTLKVSANADREILTTAKIPSDLTPYGIPFGAGTFYLHTPVFLNNDKTLGFVTQGATAIVATIAATGGDLKIWDAQPEGGFGRTFTDPTKGSHLMLSRSRQVASVT